MSRSAHVREVVRNFGPVFVGRGVVQISAYVDAWIASLLISGSVAALTYAQTALRAAGEPVRHVGLGRRAAGDGAPARRLRTRSHGDATRGSTTDLRRIAFLVVPSAVAFLASASRCRRRLPERQVRSAVAVWVWGMLAGSAVGLLATTLGAAVLVHALRAARHADAVPVRARARRAHAGARLRVRAAAARCARARPAVGRRGLTVAAGLAGWVEFALLGARSTGASADTGYLARASSRLWSAAAAAAGVAWAVRMRRSIEPAASGRCSDHRRVSARRISS